MRNNPKMQYSECLLYWNQGTFCCTCGLFLVESDSNQNFSQWRLDVSQSQALGRPPGARHCKTETQRGTSKSLMRGGDVCKKFFRKIHDRFEKNLRFRDSQLKVDGLRKNASRWTSSRRKIPPIAHQPRSLRDLRKPGLSLRTHLAEMHPRNFGQTAVKH